MKYVLVLLLITAHLFVVAQSETRKKQRISIGRFHTVAIGNFASIDEDNYKAGFAEVGKATSVSYQIILTKNSNLVFGFIRAEHEFNEIGFKESIDFHRSWINRNVFADNYRLSFFTFGYKFSGGSQVVKGFVNPFLGYSRKLASKWIVLWSERRS